MNNAPLRNLDSAQVEAEWRTTPTDLGGWANRAAQMLEEVKRLQADCDRLAVALERIARGAESNPLHEISEIAWEALRDA